MKSNSNNFGKNIEQPQKNRNRSELKRTRANETETKTIITGFESIGTRKPFEDGGRLES